MQIVGCMPAIRVIPHATTAALKLLWAKVGLFRQPESRIASAFNHFMGGSGDVIQRLVTGWRGVLNMFQRLALAMSMSFIAAQAGQVYVCAHDLGHGWRGGLKRACVVISTLDSDVLLA